MDEILVANFMVFHDIVEAEPYDVWIADEGWEIDYFLHENPELKTAAVLLAHRLRRLAADARRRRARGVADRRLQRRDDRAHRPIPAHPRPGDLRRRAPTTSCPTRSGPGSRRSGSWTERALRLLGLRDRGFDPPDVGDRAELRAELGYEPTRRSASSRRRLRRRRPLLRTSSRVRRGPTARARPAHDRRRGAAHRSRRVPGRDGLEVRLVHELCATWPLATSRSCRAV